MNRYRSYGNLDDQPKEVGDNSFLGVDEYNAPENIRPGNVQQAVNTDFTSQDANTRGGVVGRYGIGLNQYVDLDAVPKVNPVWTFRTAASASTQWNSIAYGAGVFVAVGNNGIINTSPDGIVWTVRSSPGVFDIKKVAFGAGAFVAVGTANGSVTKPIIRSTDGVSWSFVAGGASGSYVSVAYASSGPYGPSGSYWTAIGNARWSASSDNGATFSSAATQSELADATDIGFGNSTYLAVTSTGKIVTAPYDNLASGWVIQQTLTDAPVLYSVNYCNSVWVATGQAAFAVNDEAIFVSTDGSTFTGIGGFSEQIVRSPIYGADTFLMVGDNNPGEGANFAFYNSIYATTFGGLYKSNLILDWRSVAYGNGLFVAVAYTGEIVSCSSYSPVVNASGIYSDPSDIGNQWIMVVGHDRVIFYGDGQTPRTIMLTPYTVSTLSTIVQANNYVYLFRGDNAKPLYWDGNWNGTFAEVPDTALPSSFNSIPNSNQATYYQNRLWVRDGKDSIAASDVLAFTDYDPLANEFNLNTGNSDYVVATYPFGQNSLVAFKNKSILLLQNVEGSLSDVTVTEVTRQVGLVGINAVTSIGPDLAYVSYGNINLLTLTSTNNSLQHKTLPLSTKIRKIMKRVNWKAGYKISLGYWNNKLYVALPLDNSPFCNACVVYNFTTDNWYGEWNFNHDLNLSIQGFQIIDYIKQQRLHIVSEDGRILVIDEGDNDILPGSALGISVLSLEISTQLITRAYDTDNLNHFQRRLFVDLALNRPTFSVSAFTEGANEETVVLTDQTYSRSDSWKFNDSTYDLTNANDDYNRAYRKDYSTGPDSVQFGTGFEPQMRQELRLPLITRRQGRLSWLEVTNTQGFISVMSVGYETRPGQRANLVQV
jgi:hypothetical protein